MKYLTVSNYNLPGYIYWSICVGASNKAEPIILND